ncbi:Longitudinals lacking protein, isoforms A/B/D/L [Frankliniella fusca]|uniref:Longitudinals lacking protein, isoforms A/B/D/L n=1 Tax=Frankliniella fusca TaxID=407009 RepID=A0AAE1H650_9NEOP|nr:Longitudinals lacking protein, isoforms A/B/D/L [Frankliniella fusca]
MLHLYSLNLVNSNVLDYCSPLNAQVSGLVSGEYGHGSGPFQCCDCGRRYSYQSTLRRHMKLECGKTPQFCCDHCSYKTKRKCDLLRHYGTQHHEVMKN